MGRYYALAEGRGETVAAAIAEHYSPQGPNDRCPSAPVSVAVALADKIDSLVGFFAINEKPTSSKDPYALRRAALGVIRLIVENNLRVSLFEVFGSANSRYPDEIRAPLEMSDHDLGVVSHELLELFVTDRLKVHLRQEGARHDLVSAVFAVRRPSGGLEDDVVRLLAKIAALEEFLDTEDGGHLLTAYKRASNIVRIEEKKDSVRYDGSVERRLLRQPEEKDLYARLIEVKRQNDKALRHERYVEAMEILARLRRLVDIFFDDVTVNCTDKTLRRNRLRLLSQIRTTMNTVADFSQIEG
jgi:glycyl-tRNA synthetase beta chain